MPLRLSGTHDHGLRETLTAWPTTLAGVRHGSPTCIGDLVIAVAATRMPFGYWLVLGRASSGNAGATGCFTIPPSTGGLPGLRHRVDTGTSNSCPGRAILGFYISVSQRTASESMKMDIQGRIDAGAEHGRETFRQFLRRARAEIPRDAQFLGPVPRHPNRAGKPVTQEELAEGLGITREWYARIELGIHERVPPPLLTRLAELLMLDRSEREALFALAIPGLRSGQLRPDSTSVLQLASLRPILRRLWSASSETEIFANVLEFTQSIFPEADNVHYSRRVGPRQWDMPLGLGPENAQRRLESLLELFSELSPDKLEQITVSDRLVRPGDTLVLRRFGDIPAVQNIPHFQRRFGLANSSKIGSRVRSRKGFVANITLVRIEGCFDVSDSRVPILSTLADITSLALSS